MTCVTKNVIYLISCKMNNHRQRLNQMCDLFLYQHVCSNGHSEDDIAIMPIKVTLEEGECLSFRRNTGTGN